MSRCASHFSSDHFHLPAHWDLLLLSMMYSCEHGIFRHMCLHATANKWLMIVSFLLLLFQWFYWISCYFFFHLLSWFHGDLSRHAAEALLLSNGIDGSYLLRNSNAGLGCFALSVRLADNKPPTIKHVITHVTVTWQTSLLNRSVH